MADFKDSEAFPKQQTEEVVPTAPKFLGMPLPPHLGQQFIRVYRGLHASHIGDQDMHSVDLNDVGGHWTHDRDVAMGFISGNASFDKHGKSYFDSITPRKDGLHGLLLEGYVNKDDKEKNPEVLKDGVVFKEEHPEKEFTVRGGGKVHLTKISKYKVHASKDPFSDNLADAVAQPEFKESQEFKEPIVTTTKPVDREGYVARQVASGRTANFDTGLGR